DLERELDPLTRMVTNNESYFFREAAQLEALQSQLVAELMADGVAGKLRLLSAGCAAGEEPYSINIQVRTHCLGLQTENFAIDAIDIDSERLEMARRAVYRPNSLRTLNDDQLGRFFIPRGNEAFELRPTFRHGVYFGHGNIIDLASHPARTYDIIFCRNVLIYFAEPALKVAIENFARLLRPGGLLFLGHSESIIGLTRLFQVERIEGCIAYRRTSD
ncbi:MAG: CheR family methyltransferase, partial [Thermoanaerobaculia bacterium]